jgi:hypothetical protein
MVQSFEGLGRTPYASRRAKKGDGASCESPPKMKEAAN